MFGSRGRGLVVGAGSVQSDSVHLGGRGRGRMLAVAGGDRRPGGDVDNGGKLVSAAYYGGGVRRPGNDYDDIGSGGQLTHGDTGRGMMLRGGGDGGGHCGNGGAPRNDPLSDGNRDQAIAGIEAVPTNYGINSKDVTEISSSNAHEMKSVSSFLPRKSSAAIDCPFVNPLRFTFAPVDDGDEELVNTKAPHDDDDIRELLKSKETENGKMTTIAHGCSSRNGERLNDRILIGNRFGPVWKFLNHSNRNRTTSEATNVSYVEVPELVACAVEIEAANEGRYICFFLEQPEVLPSNATTVRKSLRLKNNTVTHSVSPDEDKRIRKKKVNAVRSISPVAAKQIDTPSWRLVEHCDPTEIDPTSLHFSADGEEEEEDTSDAAYVKRHSAWEHAEKEYGYFSRTAAWETAQRQSCSFLSLRSGDRSMPPVGGRENRTGGELKHIEKSHNKNLKMVQDKPSERKNEFGDFGNQVESKYLNRELRHLYSEVKIYNGFGTRKATIGDVLHDDGGQSAQPIQYDLGSRHLATAYKQLVFGAQAAAAGIGRGFDPFGTTSKSTPTAREKGTASVVVGIEDPEGNDAEGGENVPSLLVEPYQPRSFPLSDAEYRSMLAEMPCDHQPYPPSPRRTTPASVHIPHTRTT